MNEESDYEVVLKRLAMICGIIVLLISAYFSYDGFDQQVTGGNSEYTTLAKGIGVVMCIVMSLFQFILSSRYDQLNTTLKVVGFASYIYSIYTTYLGAVNIMGMSNEMAIAVALMFDIAPEPAIAWSFGDSLKGDLFGNLGKAALGVIGIKGSKGSQSKQNNQPKQGHQPQPNTQPNPNRHNHQGNPNKKKMDDRRAELSKMYHGPDRREGEREKQPQVYRNLNGNDYED
jgi:Flp pilus assembly pilin Flp